MTDVTGRILVVDDDAAILRVVATGLRARGHKVLEAATGAAGLDSIAVESPDLVILDLGLPDIGGVEVCRRVREFSSVQIIVLSVESADDRKIEALDAGADDFVTKPFSMGELLARVRATLRRTTSSDESPILEVGPLVIDIRAHVATLAGRRLDLTETEYRILLELARNAGRLLTHRMLLERVWGPGYDRETHYVRVYVSRLRRKLEPERESPRLLMTVPRAGYRLEAPLD